MTDSEFKVMKKAFTRRDFIKTAGAVLGTSLLAACSPLATTQVTTLAVNQVITTTSTPLSTPEPVVLEVWWNADLPDLTTAEWKNDPNDPVFQAEWYWGGLGRVKYRPWLATHPGVTLNITTHSWDVELHTNQLLAIASGQSPDTTYGEAYVSEFAQMGVYAELSLEAAAKFPAGPLSGATIGGKVYGLPKSTGADVLFINLDKVSSAGADPARLPTTWDELLTLAQAISKENYNAKWGHMAYYTWGAIPGGSYGSAMRVLHWFNQNHAPLVDSSFNPQANLAASTDTWLFHNQLVWTSTWNLINVAGEEVYSGQYFNDGEIALKPGWSNDAALVGATVNAAAIPFPLPPGGKPATIVIGNDMESAFTASKYLDIAKLLVEETTTDETAQAFLASTCGVWIPALKSLLSQYATYDKLDGYCTNLAKELVRVTMQQALEGNAGPVPGWKKNGVEIWTAWNASYGRILGDEAPGMAKTDIQKELDTLQAYIVSKLA